ncbi:MAG: terminase small subunit [Alphaproteobacteria bacterium]
MTPKQQRFVEEYLVDLNGAQAAIRAGYAPKRASDTARKTLKNREVADAVAAGMAAKRRRAEISADRVIFEYARIAFADIAEFVRFGPDGMEILEVATLSKEQTAAIAEVTETKTQRGGTVRFKLHDKLAALNALARHLGVNAPEKLALTDASGADAEPVDSYEIARRIAFALRQGEEARRVAEESGGGDARSKKLRFDA